MPIYAYILIFITASAFCYTLRFKWWEKKKTGLLVLSYHNIGKPPKKSKFKQNWTEKEVFEKQLDYILSQGYTTLTFDDLNEIQNGAAQMPSKPLLITFNDGLKNNCLLLDILKQKKAKANIFFVFDAIDKYNLWQNSSKELWQDMLTSTQIKELLESGLVGFGSHSLSHKNLKNASYEEAEHEIKESKFRFEQKFGKEIYAFLPPGETQPSARTRELVFKSGYKFLFCGVPGINELPLNTEAPIKRITIERKHYFAWVKAKLNKAF
ncbi:Putative chitin deacetylase [Elusimicrobium minutum Pei191]|uniref:Putative chitin deacetylase n=1 Tax=Elusimicrobium minutum (strain Pei191) TaxID=445932 RepID=B2KC53_ELUMP|nr:polysaccharide deacetylase family protein [Elusimicrobium minutum]ACC98180.1 Putative chitin deacetylase [Elusimicrobium minutum Pei191]